MMRALWAGVTGLQAHQIAMDVEGNNIANVNTTGYKYSRANFSNLLNQTATIATAPQGDLGGKNAMQIGLGTQISTVTKIFEQGSIETTDKDTDLAISGDGFFIVSPDGGSTYKYTRNGDFSFDANGNFVDSNGYIIQGWKRDETTGQIDSTSPITGITIPPGLTTPANATSTVTIKANLDSGNSVGTNKSVIYSLDQYNGWVDTNGDGIMQASEVHDENDAGSNVFDTNKDLYERGQDFGVLFDSDGNALNLTDGQGSWISYAQAKTNTIAITANSTGTTTVDLMINGTAITGKISSTDDDTVATYIAGLINAQTSSTGVEAKITGGNGLYLTNDNQTGTEAATKNIKLNTGSTDTTGLTDTDVITAYQYTYSSTPLNSPHSYDDSVARTFTTTEDLREAMQKDARLYADYTGDGYADKNDGVTVTVNDAGQFEIANPAGDAFNSDDGDIVNDTLIKPITATSTYLNTQLSLGSITLPAGTTLGADIIPSSNVTINGIIYGPTGTSTTIPAGTKINNDPVTIPQGSAVGTSSTISASTLQTDLNTSNVAIAFGETITNSITLPSTYTGSITIGSTSTSSGTTYSAGDTIPAGSVITTLDGTIVLPQGSKVNSTTINGTSASISASTLDTTLDSTDVYIPEGTTIGADITLPSTFSGTITTNISTYSSGDTIPAGETLTYSAMIPQGSTVDTAGGSTTVIIPGASTSKDMSALNTTLSTSSILVEAGQTIGTDVTLPAGFNGTITATVFGVSQTYSAGNTIPSGAILSSTAVIPSGSTVNTTGNNINILTGATTTLETGTNFKAADDYDLYLTVTSLTDAANNVSANDSFTTTINALQGTLTSGTSTRTSQSVYAATLASSIDVYDSLGSKHTVRLEYTKTGYTTTGGTEWSVLITVPEPGDINLGNYPKNIVTGTVSFNSDGSLATYTPRNLTYTANNGSTPNQNIALDFGTLGQFDGMTSFDKDSSTSGISQDGYSGGDLSGISVDETGTVIGSFTNGRSFGLAQVAMATFSNNGGLESDGGNCYIQTSNSGDPIVGQASTGGKGAIESSSLEMSNVDLSRSLTQLIVIQRGYQANSKTITTADEMLNTLLQLK